MATRALQMIPAGSDVFIDANIFIYGLSGRSVECRAFLERCSREEVYGVTLFEIVNEATHRLMLGEAFAKGLIPKPSAQELRSRWSVVSSLVDYWLETERILALNILFLPSEEALIRRAEVERKASGLLTNDSMIAACMRELGVSILASNDADFDRAAGLTLYQPRDV